MYGDGHFSFVKYDNKFYKTGSCSELGDVDKETFKGLKDLCESQLGHLGMPLMYYTHIHTHAHILSYLYILVVS